MFLRGNRGGKAPPEPIYVVPDPYSGRTIAGGTPDGGWPGVDSGPGIGAVASRRPGSGDAGSGGSGGPGGGDTGGGAPGSGGPGAPGGGPGSASGATGATDSKRLTLDAAIARAITGDLNSNQALLDTVRELRGLPPGTSDQVINDLAANMQRARDTVAAEIAAGGTPGKDGQMSALDRTVSINRQILRNEILKQQGLDPSKEEAAAKAVDERLKHPGAAGGPVPIGEIAVPAEPAPVVAPAEPSPAPIIEHDGR